MKTLRHVAACLLVGWYLLIPPTVHRTEKQFFLGSPAVQAPLWTWEYFASFDTAAQCERERRVQAQFFFEGEPGEEGMAWGNSLQCVVSDDPRLKH